MKKLLVIIPDRLSDITKKGEVIPRYYNPGNVFSEVHIVMTNDDKPSIAALQTMVGDAKLTIHNFPPPAHFFRNTLGWQLPLMRSWAQSFIELAKTLDISLVRTHNNFLEGYLAASLKKTLGIPYVTSLHGVWDVDELRTIKSKIHRLFRTKIEIMTLSNAAQVLCVYSPILDYARRHGARNPLLVPNFVGGDYIRVKQKWEFDEPVKLITVNRQLAEKNPENIIKALALLPYKFEYTIIGDGILHNYLQQLAAALPKDKKITFYKSLPNEQVCALYAQNDFMVSNCHYKGISKTIIEAGLSGLPIILNKYNDGYILAEYEDGWIEKCPDTPEGYAYALDKLILSYQKRSELGRRAIEVTTDKFSPQVLENRVANLYREILAS